jgi:hypothetical protein
MRKLGGMAYGCIVTAVTLSVAACSSDNSKHESSEAGTGGASTAGAGGKGSGGKANGGTSNGGGGAGNGGAGGQNTTDGGDGGVTVNLKGCEGKTEVQCGEYLVKHVIACGDCHSERLPSGAIDPAFFLAGNATFADLDPADNTKGLVPTPNLTQLKNQGWTKADVKSAILDGKKPASLGGGGLFPIMPYYVFHNMGDAAADAIATYILSLTPIAHDPGLRQPLPGPLANVPLPFAPFDKTKIPDTTLPTTDPHYADAQTGKFIAGEIGICLECHTKHVQGPTVLDTTKLFAGGEDFQLGPSFTVTSLNITPANSGIHGWTAQDVQKVLLQGVDKDGMALCPPMPFGPNGAFGGMDPADALAVGYYITTIAPIENPADGGRIPMCVPPSPPGDGGMMPDASMPMDASTKG